MRNNYGGVFVSRSRASSVEGLDDGQLDHAEIELAQSEGDDSTSVDDEVQADGHVTEGQGASDYHGNGLTVFKCTVCLVGELAGTGILALPSAMNSTGYIGVLVMVVAAAVLGYTGKILGDCWILTQERYDEYRGHVRYPYAAIGQMTYGRCGRISVTVCIFVTMTGAAIVFLILASENIHSLLGNMFGIHISFCYLLVTTAIFLCPLSWLGTPKDFWPIAVGATVSTTAAVFIILVVVVRDSWNVTISAVQHSNPGVVQLFTGVSTIIFTFGGHPAFPTFQNDMKVPRKFGRVVGLSYVCLTLNYLPVALAGFIVYGKHVVPNFLNTLPPGPPVYVVQMLMTSHLICSFTIVVNPVMQEIDDLLRLPETFNWRRLLARSLLVAFVLLMAESVPRFSVIMALVGGSSMTFLSCVFPPLFYLKMCKMKGSWPRVTVPIHVKVFLLEVVVIGCVTCAVTTYGALLDMFNPGAFSKPCYLWPNDAGS